jgi:hypothetical protein
VRFIPVEIFSFFNSNSRGWHDTLSVTYVVNKHEFLAKQNCKPVILFLGIQAVILDRFFVLLGSFLYIRSLKLENYSSNDELGTTFIT